MAKLLLNFDIKTEYNHLKNKQSANLWRQMDGIVLGESVSVFFLVDGGTEPRQEAQIVGHLWRPCPQVRQPPLPV